MRTCFTLLGSDYVADYDYKVTSHGCSAHYGSLSYAGHPAEPMEFEVTLVDLREDLPGKESPSLDCLPWMRDLIEEHIAESDEVYREIEEAELEDCRV